MIRKIIPEPIKELYRLIRARMLSIGLARNRTFEQPAFEAKASRYMSVIVPILDSPEVLIRCLHSLEIYAPHAEVILVDDGSTMQETLDILQNFKRRNKWLLIRNDESKGHSRACESGACLATRSYLCFLNSDTVVTPWSWSAAKEAFEADPRIAVTGPSTSRTSTIQTIRRAEHCRNYWTDSQIYAFSKKYISKQEPKSRTDLPAVGGFAFFIRRSVWEQFRGFDINLRDYGNESELCKRLSQKGFRIVWTQNSYIHHFGKKSYGLLLSSDEMMNKRLAAKDYIDRLHGPTTTVQQKNAEDIYNMPLSKGCIRNTTSVNANEATTQKMDIDLIFITHNRLEYTKKSLESIIADPLEEFALTIWDNASSDGTKEYLEYVEDPRIKDKIFSKENVGQTAAVNEIWNSSRAELLGKLDNDCIVTPGWTRKFAKAHNDIEKLGVVAMWHFFEEDFDYDRARHKIQEFNGHRIFIHPWTCGTGLLIKRSTFQEFGPIKQGSTTRYWLMMAKKGYVNGFYFPLVFQEHMDDPRSKYSRLRKMGFDQAYKHTFGYKEGLLKNGSQYAKLHENILKNLLDGPYDPSYYTGWRRKIRKLKALFTTQI